MITQDISKIFGIDQPDQVPNGGGLLEDIRFIPAIGIDSFQLQDCYLVEGSLKLKPGFSWQVFRTAFDTLDHSTESSITANGVTYKHKLVFLKGIITPFLAAWVDKYTEVEMVFMAKTRNGYTILIGLPFEPLLLTLALAQGSRKAKNAIGFQYEGLTTKPALFVSQFDDAVSYLTMTTDASKLQALLDADLLGLLDRIAALEESKIWFDDSMFRVVRFEFSKTDLNPIGSLSLTNINSTEARKLNFDLTKGSLLAVSLNGVAMDGRLSSMDNFDSNKYFDDIIIIAGTSPMIYFNISVDFVDNNILQIFVKVKA